MKSFKIVGASINRLLDNGLELGKTLLFTAFGLLFISILGNIAISILAIPLRLLGDFGDTLRSMLQFVVAFCLGCLSMALTDVALTNLKTNVTISFKTVISNLASNITVYLTAMIYSIISYFFRLWWLNIIQGIAIILMVFGTVSFNLALSGVGLFILIATIVLYAVLGLSLAYVAIAKVDDPNRTRRDCVELSLKLTNGYKATTFASMLLASIIPFIGGVVVAPVTSAMLFCNRLEELGMASFDTGNEVNNTSGFNTNFDSTPTQKQSQGMASNASSGFDDFDNAQRQQPQRAASSGFDDFEQAPPKKAESAVYKSIVQAIQGANVVNLTTSTDGFDSNTRKALPIDIVGTDGNRTYNFFIQDENKNVKAVKVDENTIQKIEVLNNRFNPKQYVTWSNPKWNIPRNWSL